MNKRGVLGMDTVKAVMVLLLTLAVVAIALFIALVSLDPTVGKSGSIVNSSFTLTDANLSGVVNSEVFGLDQPILVDLVVNENSTTLLVETTDYTVNLITGGIVGVGTSGFNNTLVNATFLYSDNAERQTDFLITNTTSGATEFFDNMPTVFTILGAVVIILAVVLILFAVNRFTAGSGASNLGGGGRTGTSRDGTRL